jgi:hypothetical protein
MGVTDEQLRVIEQRITHAVRAVDSHGGEPNELWARIEQRIDHRPRRRWFRVGLAIATVTAVLAAISIRQLVDDRPAKVSSASTAGAVETIEAVCQSLLSMRHDVVPLPDEAFELRFTIRRIQATYSSAATAIDAIDVPPALREARVAWQSIFEVDARHRLDQAAIDIDVAATPTVKELVGGSLAMMISAVTELYDAGVGACNPNT